MKTALFAAAAALAISTGATILSSAPAFADSGYTSVYRPFGSKMHSTERFQERLARRHAHEQRYVYVPAPRSYVSPEVRHARAHLADVRYRAYADGRVTLIEKIKLRAAENRLERAKWQHR
jgi:hypothetical protein